MNEVGTTTATPTTPHYEKGFLAKAKHFMARLLGSNIKSNDHTIFAATPDDAKSTQDRPSDITTENSESSIEATTLASTDPAPSSSKKTNDRKFTPYKGMKMDSLRKNRQEITLDPNEPIPFLDTASLLSKGAGHLEELRAYAASCSDATYFTPEEMDRFRAQASTANEATKSMYEQLLKIALKMNGVYKTHKIFATWYTRFDVFNYLDYAMKT